MPYHVSKNNQSKVIIEQDDLLKAYLSQCTPGDIVIVEDYDYIKRGTRVFGPLSGAEPFPDPPSFPTPSNTIVISHLTKNNQPL